ncbi:MAG: glycosyltransferase family 2 protein [Anaerolineae bacterium]
MIPTYNRAHLLPRAMGSVLKQTYRRLELIIVDDAGNDGTHDAVRAFGDERVKYIRHATNLGPGGARNTGIRAALGEYIAFQDSDDEWHPRKLERQMACFSEQDDCVGVVYCPYWRVSGATRVRVPLAGTTCGEGNMTASLLRGNHIGTPAVVARARFLHEVGLFDESLPQLEDYELWLRLSKACEFHMVDEPLVTAYLQAEGDSRTLNPGAQIRALQLILAAHGAEYSRYPDLLAERLYSIGYLLLLSGQLGEGRRYLRQALVNCPRLLKPRVALLLSYAGPRAFRSAPAVSEWLRRVRRRLA